ncbi:MAG: hypothetical protein J3Q66DRAFT_366846 [Benniella sp.]|nr:MAG: hypothetical protein J3Q66DRAFT_366846 [Benniella sp.]
MVSRIKIVGLSLLAALASAVNAYTWYARIVIPANFTPIKFRIHPLDAQVPGNEQALVWEGEDEEFEPNPPPFSQYGYEDIVVDLSSLDPNPELRNLVVLGESSNIQLPCQKYEDYKPSGSNDTWKVYVCSHAMYNGRKGIPVP